MKGSKVTLFLSIFSFLICLFDFNLFSKEKINEPDNLEKDLKTIKQHLSRNNIPFIEEDNFLKIKLGDIDYNLTYNDDGKVINFYKDSEKYSDLKEFTFTDTVYNGNLLKNINTKGLSLDYTHNDNGLLTEIVFNGETFEKNNYSRLDTDLVYEKAYGNGNIIQIYKEGSADFYNVLINNERAFLLVYEDNNLVNVYNLKNGEIKTLSYNDFLSTVEDNNFKIEYLYDEEILSQKNYSLKNYDNNAVNYSIDESGNLITEHSLGVDIINYTTDSPSSFYYPSDIKLDEHLIQHKYNFYKGDSIDSTLQVLGETFGNIRYEYNFTRNGRLLGIETFDKNNKIIDYENFDYDEQGRLIYSEKKSGWGEDRTQYFYDERDNFTRAEEYSKETSLELYEMDENYVDLLRKKGELFLDYDRIYNITSITDYYYQNQAFTYTNGTLIDTFYPDTLSSDFYYQYSYNEDGLRYEKVCSDGSYTKSFYDEEHLIYEIKKDKNGEIDYIYYFYDSLDNLVGFKLNDQIYFYCRNILGRIDYILDVNGDVVVTYIYSDFGELKEATGNQEIIKNNSIIYKDYYYDQESKLYYLKTRYYNPDLRRYMSVDDLASIERRGSDSYFYNLFSYCKNDPINLSDEYGLLAISLTIGVILGFFGCAILAPFISQGISDGINDAINDIDITESPDVSEEEGAVIEETQIYVPTDAEIEDTKNDLKSNMEELVVYLKPKLTFRLLKSIISINAKITQEIGDDIHHIIAKRSKKVANTRRAYILFFGEIEQTSSGVSIYSIDHNRNLVEIDRRLHQTLHTWSYFIFINRTFRKTYKITATGEFIIYPHKKYDFEIKLHMIKYQLEEVSKMFKFINL